MALSIAPQHWPQCLYVFCISEYPTHLEKASMIDDNPTQLRCSLVFSNWGVTEEKEGKKIIQKNAALLSVAPILLKITETEEMPGWVTMASTKGSQGRLLKSWEIIRCLLQTKTVGTEMLTQIGEESGRTESCQLLLNEKRCDRALGLSSWLQTTRFSPSLRIRCKFSG